MIGKHFLDIMMHSRFMGHQSYVLLCTETALSNHPVVIPKSSCNVHLLRSPCLLLPEALVNTVCLENIDNIKLAKF